MHIVAVTGMPGAGKELAVEVAQERGWPVLRMGDLVRQEARRRHAGLEPDHVAATASALRAERGAAAWAELVVPILRQYEREGARFVLVDGVRNADEVQLLRRTFQGRFVLVAVDTATDVRHRRLVARARPDDVQDPAWAAERDRREMGYGLGGALALADTRVHNEGTVEEFQAAFGKVLDGIEAGAR